MNLDQLRKEIKEKEEEKYEDAKEKYEKEILFELSQFKDTKNNFLDRLMYGQALFIKKIGKLTQLMDLLWTYLYL